MRAGAGETREPRHPARAAPDRGHCAGGVAPAHGGDNPDIYHLVLELLADAGVLAPRRAPTVASLAAVIQQISGGNGWTVIASTVARHVLPGTVAVPLRVSSRHNVQFALVWHASVDHAIISAFSDKLQGLLMRHSADRVAAARHVDV